MVSADDAKKQADEFDLRVPKRIRNLRQSLFLPAEKLDQLVGFSIGTTGRLERGKQRIFASHIYRICQITGVNIGYFYDLKDRKSPTKLHRDMEKYRLLQVYHHIDNPAMKHDVFELIEAIANNYEKSTKPPNNQQG